MNVLLSTEVIIQEPDSGESTYEIYFDGSFRLSFVFEKITIENKKNMPAVEEMEESKVDPNHLKLKVRYCNEDAEFGFVDKPMKLFLRRLKNNSIANAEEKKEQVFFNFFLEKRLGDTFFLRLLILSK